MSFNDIRDLRKEGSLKEAYKLALSEIKEKQEAGDDNGLLWAKRGMSWVLYDSLKKIISKLEERFDKSEFNKLMKTINIVSKLGLPKEEELFFEQFTWQVGSALGCLDPERHVNEAKQIFNGIKEFDLSESYEPYRILLIRFHQTLKNDPFYTNIIEWWNTDNFRSSDYQEKTNDEGRTYSSLAEQVLTNYYKHVVDGIDKGSIQESEVDNYLRKLKSVIQRNPEFKYLHYRQAQLLKLSGREEEAVKAFLPYAKKNTKQTWVWGLLGELHSSNRDIQISCYCKALSIQNKEDFVSKIRVKLAEQFINQKKYDEAKTEIERYYDFRTKNGYKVTNKVNNWIGMPWYQNAAVKQSNKPFYDNNLKKAERILYQDIPEKIVVVEFVNRNVNIINYLESRTSRGFFNYSEFDIKPQIGDVYKVRMTPEGDEGYHIVYSLTKSDIGQAEDLFKKFSGKISIHEGNNFGIVDCNPSIFVDGRAIKKYQLSDADTVSGIAMANYDKKKNMWGWRLITLTN